MDDEAITDVSSLDFEPWVKFVFGHPVVKYPNDSWYWNSGESFIASNPARLLKHFTELCSNFTEIASRYTLQQIDQGIWFLLSEPNRLGEHLANASIPADIRLACIRSMSHVYSDFVAKSKVEVMENCFDMWWDLVCKSFWSQLSFREVHFEGGMEGKTFSEICASIPNVSYDSLNTEERSLLDAMFETLAEILKLNEERCVAYALHGLGHLKHPSVKSLVQNFIELSKDSISEEGLKWVESCRDGTVM